MKPVEYYIDMLEPLFRKNAYSNVRFSREDCVQEQKLAVIEKYRRLEKEGVELEDGQLILCFTKRALGQLKNFLSKQGNEVSFSGFAQYNKNKDSLPIRKAYCAASGVIDDTESQIYTDEILSMFDKDNLLLYRMHGLTYETIGKIIGLTAPGVSLRLKKIQNRVKSFLQKEKV